MKNKIWRATLTAAAMALNFFTATAVGTSSAAAPRQTQRKHNTADAEGRANRQRRELIKKIIAPVVGRLAHLGE